MQEPVTRTSDVNKDVKITDPNSNNNCKTKKSFTGSYTEVNPYSFEFEFRKISRMDSSCILICSCISILYKKGIFGSFLEIYLFSLELSGFFIIFIAKHIKTEDVEYRRVSFTPRVKVSATHH